jgi:hypothetical protein
MENVASQQHYGVVVARNAAEIDSLRAAWRTLLEQQDSPIFNAEPDRLLALVGSQQNVRPHIMLLTRNGQPAAMVVGSIEEARIKCSIGYKSFRMAPLRSLTVIHGGLLGHITEEVSEALLEQMKKLLQSSEIDVVFFHYLDTESSVYKGLTSKIGGLCRSHFCRVTMHRTMTVPENLEAFYLSCSKKHRANLRRYVRRLEEQYAERLVVTRYTREDSVDSFVEAASRVSAKTYQHGLGCGMQGDDRTRTLLRDMARNGWLRGHVMFLDGEPCAFQYGATYGKKFFLEQMGFDPKWKEMNVGTALFLEALKDLCDEGQAKILDFGFGEAEYKQRYGDRQWTDVSFYLFAPRVRPILANLVHSGTTGLSLGLAYILKKTNLMGRIKRRWRDQLQKSETEQKE